MRAPALRHSQAPLLGAGPLPAAVDLAAGRPTMGTVPSALKHCLSYQHLLKEQPWIGEPVPPPQPGQVPPRA